MASGNGRPPTKREWAVYGPLDFEHRYPEDHPTLAGQFRRLPVDKNEVESMAADVANVVVMVGGTALMAADRGKDDLTGMWETYAVYWEWHQYAPSSHTQAAAPRGKRGGEKPQEAPAPPVEAALEDEPDPDEFTPLSEAEAAFVAAEEEPV